MSNYYIGIPQDEALYHYGVKGMKWGVRHDKLRSNSRRNGLSDKQKQAIKIGVIAVGSALAIYGGYQLYKAMGRRPSTMLRYGVSESLQQTLHTYPSNDISLKPNTKLQRVSQESYEDLRVKGHTYLSYKFRDNQRYLSGFRKEANLRTGSKSKNFVHKIVSKERLKIASPGTVAKEYLKLDPKASDQTFRMVVSPYNTSTNSNDKLAFHINNKRSELFKSLRKQGYAGIVDIEDASKLKGSTPLIVFDPDKYVKVVGTRKIGKAETFLANILK